MIIPRLLTMLLIIFLTTFLGVIECKKVLIYLPITGHSHLKFMGTIGNILQDEGYNVTLLTPLLDQSLRHTTPLIRKIHNQIMVEADEQTLDSIKDFGGKNSRKRAWSMNTGIYGFLELKRKIGTIFSNSCSNIFYNQQLLQKLKNEKFDIAISEPLFICGFALFDHLKIPLTISTDSHIGLETTKIAHGSPTFASFLPSVFSSGLAEKMTLFGRLKNFIETFMNNNFVSHFYEEELAAISHIYKGEKNWKKLLVSTSYVFENTCKFLDIPIPKIPKFIEIGGITMDKDNRKLSKPHKLPEDYDEILSLRSKTVLISFGTNAKSIDLPNDMKTSLIRTFESMPDVTFIWKYENASIDIVKSYNSKIDNVILSEWMPQTELLADPRLTLFVTHGGLGSTNEVAFSGKPAIMVPVFGDQTRNARMLERHGTAIILQKQDLRNEAKVRAVIQEGLNNPIYSKNAHRLAQLLNNDPESPKRTFLKYFNFLAKYGKPNGIDSYAAEMTIIEYYFLDWMLIFTFSGLFIMWTASKVYCEIRVIKSKVN